MFRIRSRVLLVAVIFMVSVSLLVFAGCEDEKVKADEKSEACCAVEQKECKDQAEKADENACDKEGKESEEKCPKAEECQKECSAEDKEKCPKADPTCKKSEKDCPEVKDGCSK